MLAAPSKINILALPSHCPNLPFDCIKYRFSVSSRETFACAKSSEVASSQSFTQSFLSLSTTKHPLHLAFFKALAFSNQMLHTKRSGLKNNNVVNNDVLAITGVAVEGLNFITSHIYDNWGRWCGRKCFLPEYVQLSLNQLCKDHWQQKRKGASTTFKNLILISLFKFVF